jgi:hypothetical protein
MMPRYLVETDERSIDRLAAAVDLADLRFPEVAVELRRRSDPASPDVSSSFVCRAPSVTHVRRWLGAAGIVEHSISINQTGHGNDEQTGAITP